MRPLAPDIVAALNPDIGTAIDIGFGDLTDAVTTVVVTLLKQEENVCLSTGANR